MHTGVNENGVKSEPKLALQPPPSFGDRISRAIERCCTLTDEEMAAVRVEIVALMKVEKRDAWNAGAEHMDREWWESDYNSGPGARYWGYIESTKNPYR